MLTASDAINCPDKPLNFELEGMAAYEKEAEQARRITGLNIYSTKLENWKTTNKYDVIVCINVLEHIPNLREFIGKIYELLENDGIFASIVPNNYLFDKKIKLNRKKYLNPNYGSIMACEHINHFTAETIKKLLSDQKFRKVEFKPVLVPRTRYWEKETSKSFLIKRADYYLCKNTKKAPHINYLFSVAMK